MNLYHSSDGMLATNDTAASNNTTSSEKVTLSSLNMDGLLGWYTEISVYNTNPDFLVQGDQWTVGFENSSIEEREDIFNEAKHCRDFNSAWINIRSGKVRCNGEEVKGLTGGKIILSVHGHTVDMSTDIDEHKTWNPNLTIATFVNDNDQDDIVLRLKNGDDEDGDYRIDYAKPDFLYGLLYKETEKGIMAWLVKFSQFGINSTCQVLCKPDFTALAGIYEDIRTLILKSSGKELLHVKSVDSQASQGSEI